MSEREDETPAEEPRAGAGGTSPADEPKVAETPTKAEEAEAPPAEAAKEAHGAHGQRPAGEEPGWFEHKENIDKMLRVFWGLCALLFALDLIDTLGIWHFKHPHEGHVWQKFPGFFAIYGFVACVVLVEIAKQMRKVVMRDEDYYEHE